jgi:hypothetical protein
VILGLFWFLLANAAAALGAHEITRRVRTGRAPLDTLLFLLVRIALISGTILVAGVTHLLTALGLGLVAAAALIGLVAAGAHQHVRRPELPEAGRILWIVAGVVGLRLLCQVWFFAPHLGDALAYHLPKIAEWVIAGHFTREMGLHPHVTFPAGFELVETWWVVFLHHDVLIEMAGVEFLALAFAATYALARYFNLTARWAFFAALLYAMTPGLHLSATSCLNDTPVAALVVATFALVVWRAPVAMVLMTAGLGIGVKATYGYALPGVVLFWMFVRKHPAIPASSRAWASALAVLGLLAGSFWYGRNLLWYGNPVYPVGSPRYAEEPVAVQAGPNLQSFWANASDLVESRMADNQGPYGANVDNIAGWGPAAFACGLVALLVALRDDPKLRPLALSFTMSLASCFLLMIHDPWCLKYVFFFPAILCIAVARLAAVHLPVVIIAAASMAFTFAGTLLPYDLQLKHLRVLAAQPWQTRSALLLTEPPLSEPRMGCFGGFRANAYHLYGPGFSRKVVYLRAGSEEDLIFEMRNAGIQWVYAVPVSYQQQTLLDECLRTGRLRPVGGRIFALGPKD